VIRDEIFFNTAGGKTNLANVSDDLDGEAEKGGPVGSHEVLRLHRPQRHNLIATSATNSQMPNGKSAAHLVISPRITHHTDGLDRQQSHKRLTDLVVQSGRSNFLNVDVVGLLKNLDLLAGDLAEDADGKTGAGEGVAADEVGGDIEESAECADFV
jgi:hypothetical protein